MVKKALVFLSVFVSLLLSGCSGAGEAVPFTPATVEKAGGQATGEWEALLDEYFTWRGNSFGAAAHGENIPQPEKTALPLEKTVIETETERVEKLQDMMEDWGCLYSGAHTVYRVDGSQQHGDKIILFVYETAHFNSWYKQYSTPNTADTSGYGVRHVLTLVRTEEGYRINADDYTEGRPTFACSPGYLTNPYYLAYAGLPSQTPRTVTGRPPAYPVNNPVYAQGYDPAAAVAYAQQWAPGRNTAVFGDYSRVGGDCCNFASQCLAAGGLTMDDTWYSTEGKGSLAWISSTRLYRYLTQEINCGKGIAVIRQRDTTGRTLTIGDRRYRAEEILLPGSPVFYRWGGGFIGDDKWSHTAICVGTLGDGTPAVSCHTGDKINIKWNYGGEACDYGTVQMTPADP